MPMIEKGKRIRLKKIRDSARNQPCTVNSPWCNYDDSTTCFAHYGEPGEKGMGLKPDDTSGMYACSACHDWIDGRTSPKDAHLKRDYCFRAMRRTWALLVTNGVLK